MYRYRVFAVNRVGATSAPSQEVEVKTLPPPAVVADFTAVTNQVRCVPLSWKANQEKDVTGYELERAEDGGFSRLEDLKAGDTTFLDGGKDPGKLEDDHVYRYRIRAVNSVGSCGEWTSIQARTRPLPPAPKGVEVESDLPRSVRVKWTKSPDEKVTGYIVERTEANDLSWKKVEEISGRDTTKLYDRNGAAEDAITGKLKDGTEYIYRVIAVNTAEAKSAPSAEARAVTKPAPKAPRGAKATTDIAGKIKITWDKNDEPDVVEYKVEMQSMGGLIWRELASVKNGCAAEESGLGNGEERRYRIMAIDANTHESEWSAVVSGKSRPQPDPPRALRAVRDGGRYKLTFTPPRDGMTAFKIYRKKFIGSELIKSVKTCEATIDAPPQGETIDIVVTAVDECGLESEHSEKVNVGQ